MEPAPSRPPVFRHQGGTGLFEGGKATRASLVGLGRALPPSRPEPVRRQPPAQCGKEPHMTDATETRELLVELAWQLFHADMFITEQAERIEELEAELAWLQCCSTQ